MALNILDNPRHLARLITMIERQDPARIEVLKALHDKTGKAHVVGITGPPGSGKSTLTDKIIGELRNRGRRVAVVAIDPSSPFTGGAILGDRIRMMRHATDEGVFIRSLASRGHLGGLSRAAAETVRALDAAAYDTVIIETVGVGQSEIDIVRCADTVVLVAVPGLGDDIQAIKAGVMEIGDIFCVNKADRDGAERVVRETRAMMETAIMNGANTRFSGLYKAVYEHTVQQARLRGENVQEDPHGGALRIPPVLLTIAEQGEGVSVLVDEILAHHAMLSDTEWLLKHRHENTMWELRNAVADNLLGWLDNANAHSQLANAAEAVLHKDTDYYQALAQVQEGIIAAGLRLVSD
ncbi:MAG: methylmalonyl Co-A mutase-associated GTPase MeaB [Spirochaetes bacterium]|nr:methylmalonyl Co-A mutase-associated GTPase MeaB [Spirochaetota bacterium]